MNLLTRFLLVVLALWTGRAIADEPTSRYIITPHKLASIALIDDTAKLNSLARPEGPTVTYLTKIDAHEMAERIIRQIARRKEKYDVMLSSHKKTLAITCDIRIQKILFETIAEIENPQPPRKSNSIVDLIHEALLERRSNK